AVARGDLLGHEQLEVGHRDDGGGGGHLLDLLDVAVGDLAAPDDGDLEGHEGARSAVRPSRSAREARDIAHQEDQSDPGVSSLDRPACVADWVRMTALREEALVARIRSREALVGIIGLGYVGLPLALTFSEKGFPVLGFDVDANKVEAIHAGRGY